MYPEVLRTHVVSIRRCDQNMATEIESVAAAVARAGLKHACRFEPKPICRVLPRVRVQLAVNGPARVHGRSRRLPSRRRISRKEPLMSKASLRPYLVCKDDDGAYRVTVRTTRYNSQNYPLVSSEMLTDVFKTQTAAKTFVRETYRAEASEIAIK